MGSQVVLLVFLATVALTLAVVITALPTTSSIRVFALHTTTAVLAIAGTRWHLRARFDLLGVSSIV